MEKLLQSSYQNTITWLFTGLLGFFALILSTTLVAQEVRYSRSGDTLDENAEASFRSENRKFVQASIIEIVESQDSINKRKDNSEDYLLHSPGLGTGWGSVSRVLP